jgi:hypothetical protein
MCSIASGRLDQRNRDQQNVVRERH